VSESRSGGAPAQLALRAAASLIGIKVALIAAAGILALLVFVGLFITAAGSAVGQSGATCTAVPAAAGGVPANYVPWLARAAQRYHLGPRGFSIVAAVHYVESDFGRSTLPGVAPGTTNYMGAMGPGQFLEESWPPFGVDADGDGVKDPYSIPDSIFATANLLHASGAPQNWHDALFAYNHAEWYVEKVEREAERFGGAASGSASIEGSASCAPRAPDSAVIGNAIRLFAPRAFKSLPAALWVGGGSPESVDARIWPDAVWLLETYDLRVTAAREAGHNTHGDGTAMDMVPASGRGWDGTALRAAVDLGWIPSCGASGTAPICPLVPAIQFIGYNGYPAHGDPAHAGSSAHLHVSWKSSDYGCPGLCEPREWVEVFPSVE
jgi:hypothetical protein